MKRGLSIILAMFFISICGAAQSAILTVDVAGLEAISPDTIWSYQINFDIAGGTDWFVPGESVIFNEVDQYQWEAAPGFFLTNWILNSNATGANQLVILADDKDFGDPLKSPLVNGQLFTIFYPEEVQLSLALDSFLLGSDFVTLVEMIKIPASTVFGAGENTLTFNAVPIPPALLLFGSGIIGMLGLRRKFNK